MGDEKKVPPEVTEQEKWIVANVVTAIRVEYRQTGTDTAETYLHLKSFAGKEVCWLGSTFNKVARLQLGYNSLCEPNYGLREKVEARLAYEKANARELSEYRRLKAKFEGITPPHPEPTP